MVRKYEKILLWANLIVFGVPILAFLALVLLLFIFSAGGDSQGAGFILGGMGTITEPVIFALSMIVVVIDAISALVLGCYYILYAIDAMRQKASFARHLIRGLCYLAAVLLLGPFALAFLIPA